MWPFGKRESKEARVLREAEEARASGRAKYEKLKLLSDPVPALTPLPFTLKPYEHQGETTRALSLALTKLERHTESSLDAVREQTQTTKAEAQANRAEALETSAVVRGKR